MVSTPFRALACPIDGLPLTQSDRQWHCEAGHSFDIARQGYVHLLPVQKKRTKNPGDNKAMVAARKRFLAGGFYEPLAQAVNLAVLEELSPTIWAACLDAGCGEGYYLNQLVEFTAHSHNLSLLGVDISKSAILAAAKQGSHPQWVVASNASLPILPKSVNRILCLFGFPVYNEFARVLTSGGRIIQVDAGYNHLRELREIVYPELKAPKQSRRDTPEGFMSISTETIRYGIDLQSKSTIADLLAMTPHLYRANAEGRARVAALETLHVTVDVVIRCYEKR